MLAVTGVALWGTMRRDRRAGAVLLAAGTAVTIVLAAWMRLG
jgi:hypothetical protein